MGEFLGVCCALALIDGLSSEIAGYLSRPDVRELLGVDPAVPATFQACNMAVGLSFHSADDGLHDSTAYVAALLERGVRVLVYVGTYDWGCNWIANERFVKALEWTGHDVFNAAGDRAWLVDGKIVGKTRSAGGLTFATVDRYVVIFRTIEISSRLSGTQCRTHGPLR